MPSTPAQVLDPMTGSAPDVLAELRRAALGAAAAGCYIFPVRPGQKVPAIENWEQCATRDQRVLARRWRRVAYNVGIATGPSGLVVIDLDDGRGETAPEPFSGARNGRDVFVRLAAAAGAAVPDTLTVATPTGGQHLYFRSPPDVELRNTQGRLGWRIDTRGRGGFVVAAGSVRPEGSYRVAAAAPVLELPGWLLQALTPPPRAVVPPGPPPRLHHASAYLRAILDGEADAVITAAAGHRHRTLLNAALRLGSLVAGGELSADDVRAVLLAAGIAHVDGGCDCTEASIRRTVEDGLAFSRQHPRYLRSTRDGSS